MIFIVIFALLAIISAVSAGTFLKLTKKNVGLLSKPLGKLGEAIRGRKHSEGEVPHLNEYLFSENDFAMT